MPNGKEPKEESLPMEVLTCPFTRVNMLKEEDGTMKESEQNGVRLTMKYTKGTIVLTLVVDNPGSTFSSTPQSMRCAERVDFLFKQFSCAPPSYPELGARCVLLDGIWCTVDLNIEYSPEYQQERTLRKEARRLAAQVEQLSLEAENERLEAEKQRLEAERLERQRQREAIAEEKKKRKEEEVERLTQQQLSEAKAAGCSTWEEYQQKLLDDNVAKQENLVRQKALAEQERKRQLATKAELRRQERDAQTAEEFNRKWAGKKGASPPLGYDSSRGSSSSPPPSCGMAKK
jgi:hypothetical protein